MKPRWSGWRGFAATLAGLAAALPGGAARAQAPTAPPAVGVVRAEREQVTETDQFVGRIQAIDRVALVARVTAFIDQRLFTEGAEVTKGQLLYRLEQGPFQADVAARQAAVAQMQATLRNAQLTLERAQALIRTPAGQQSTLDAALAAQQSDAAQVQAAQAQLAQSQINLGYTEIRAPIAGKISSTALTIGNVVSPTSGTLATIVSQDPMYVLFPVSVRAALDLRNRYADKGGFSAVVIRLRLPDGRDYGPQGRLDYAAPTVATSTDTIQLRGVIPNPVRPGSQAGQPGARELIDGEFVTVLLEGVEPIAVLAVPRAAVLSDQQGDYVYVVDAQNKAQRRPVQLGQSTPATAVITHGLEAGEMVIAEGLQRVRPGQPVSPGPASQMPSVPPGAQGGGTLPVAPGAAGSGTAAGASAGGAPGQASVPPGSVPSGGNSSGPGGGVVPPAPPRGGSGG